MENKKETTAPNVSVGADTEQPIFKNTKSSISECEENIKSFEEMQREMQLSLDPSYLKAVSMNDTGIILSPVLPCRRKKNKDLLAYGDKDINTI